MRRFFGSMGSISRITIESQALKNNMLNDPSVRVVDVYVPAGHDGRGFAPACGSCGVHQQWLIPYELFGLPRKRAGAGSIS